MIQLERAYDAKSSTDGIRFLAERLWPRAVKKSSLKIEAWLKDAAPSTDLRKWFSHDPAKWDEFRRRYFAELKANPDSWEPILQAARDRNLGLQFARYRAQQCGSASGISSTSLK